MISEQYEKNTYAIVIVTHNRAQMLKECVISAVSQTSHPDSIIIVNNASTDDTQIYLEDLKNQGDLYDVINLPRNIGGAGGFAKGIERALEKNVDCILIIDDDVFLAQDYMEKILMARCLYVEYRAFTGVVETEGGVDTSHRRDLGKVGLLSRECTVDKYKQSSFACDIASFCGMVIDVSLVKQIGLPHPEYFICHDDIEYSLRIHQYSRFLVITEARLSHKKKIEVRNQPRRYDWKDYYAVRNRILMVREHGNIIDRIVNFTDIFIHVIFRNWLFGWIKRDHYDWKYERKLVKAAIQDARSERVRNIIMERDE